MRLSNSRKVWPGLLVVVVAVACGAPSAQEPRSALAQRSTGTHAAYVLDANGESLTSRIVRVDPETQRVEGSYPAGYDPVMTVSPDGTRLYVASARNRGGKLRDELAVIDTVGGKVLSTTPVEDRWEGAGVSPHPSLSLSPDGLWLYVLQVRLTGGAGAEYSVATFDTTRREFLPQSIALGSCGAGFLVPSAHDGGRRLQIVCPETHDVRVLTVASNGSADSAEKIDLPRVDDGRTDANRNPLELWRLSSAVASPSGDALYAITQNGRVFTVDLWSEEVTASTDLELGPDTFVPIGQGAAGGDRLFLGAASLDSTAGIDRLRASHVLVVDAAEGVAHAAATEGAFEALGASPLGDAIFVVDSEGQTVTVIDADDPSERAVVRNVGNTPSRIEVVR